MVCVCVLLPIKMFIYIDISEYHTFAPSDCNIHDAHAHIMSISMSMSKRMSKLPFIPVLNYNFERHSFKVRFAGGGDEDEDNNNSNIDSAAMKTNTANKYIYAW